MMFTNMESLLQSWQQARTPLNLQMIREAMAKDRAALMVEGDAEIAHRFKILEEMTALQSVKGTYDYNEYMFGMANGLIFALYIMRGSSDENPPYLDRPVEWLNVADKNDKMEDTIRNPHRRLGDGTATYVK